MSEGTPLLQPGDTIDDGQAATIELLARMLVILAAIDPEAYERIEQLAGSDENGAPTVVARSSIPLAERYSGIDVGDIEVTG